MHARESALGHRTRAPAAGVRSGRACFVGTQAGSRRTPCREAGERWPFSACWAEVFECVTPVLGCCACCVGRRAGSRRTPCCEAGERWPFSACWAVEGAWAEVFECVTPVLGCRACCVGRRACPPRMPCRARLSSARPPSRFEDCLAGAFGEQSRKHAWTRERERGEACSPPSLCSAACDRLLFDGAPRRIPWQRGALSSRRRDLWRTVVGALTLVGLVRLQSLWRQTKKRTRAAGRPALPSRWLPTQCEWPHCAAAGGKPGRPDRRVPRRTRRTTGAPD
ncbi:hypothetical protein SAMN05421854_103587 [Amycolatopsis rubida]|uniref:Uncharacterized protein n=1 Tax=Amycolatopsis rubida TaxID=112413 RepID=A0A1I5LH53_9PSEU|nr:hypothetical protein SAMN05421854_103587 [Amycolatopsis rubida]